MITNEKIFQIQKIPHVDLLSNATSQRGSVSFFKNRLMSFFENIFYEAENSYKKTKNKILMNYQMTYLSKSAENQSYNADVEIFIEIKISGYNSLVVDEFSKNAFEMFHNFLIHCEYKYCEIGRDKFIEELNVLNPESVLTVSKKNSKKQEDNGSRLIFSIFDSPRDNDIGSNNLLIKTLTQYPDCAVVYSVIPKKLNESQTRELEKHKNDDEIYNYYLQNKEKALFEFGVCVFAGNSMNASAISGAVHEILKNKNNEIITTCQPLKLNAFDKLINSLKNIDGKGNFHDMLKCENQKIIDVNMPWIITATEAGRLLELPIGQEDLDGIAINKTKNTIGKSEAKIFQNPNTLKMGHLNGSAGNETVGLKFSDVPKHISVFGTPGSGKTSFTMGTLIKMHEQGIPFIVIEPVKREYRQLKKEIPALDIYTFLGGLREFTYNPFIKPPGVRVEVHKATLKAAFSCVAVGQPYEEIIAEAIDDVFLKFRWFDHFVEEKGPVFSFDDFILSLKQTFSKHAYTGINNDILTALLVRMSTLRKLFNNEKSIGIEAILNRPVLIELASVEDDKLKSLIMAIILLSLNSYITNNYACNGQLRQVLVLEEAHALLASGTQHVDGSANANLVAKNVLLRQLSENRAFGLGVMICDQSPAKVSVDVIANTYTKVVFRTVEKNDREIIENSCNLSSNQKNRLAELSVGEALLYSGSFNGKAIEINVPNHKSDYGFNSNYTDSQFIREFGEFECIKPFVNCKCAAAECKREFRIIADGLTKLSFEKQINRSLTENCDFICSKLKDNDFKNFKETNATISKMPSGEKILKYYLIQQAFKINLSDDFKTMFEEVVATLNFNIDRDSIYSCFKMHYLRKWYYEFNYLLAHDTFNSMINDIPEIKFKKIF